MAHPDADELYARALDLPPDERLSLAAKLIDSVEGPEDPEWSAAWAAELDRRMARVEAGEVALEDWQTVKASLLADLQRQ